MARQGFSEPVLLLLIAACFTACSSIDKTIPISHVEVMYRGKSNEDRPQMSSVCKGFFMSHDKVQDFFYNASRVNDADRKKYEILPCYAKGTAYIYGVKYNWIIRAGGVGEFYNDSDRFFKVCGKQCCKKVERIC